MEKQFTYVTVELAKLEHHIWVWDVNPIGEGTA